MIDPLSITVIITTVLFIICFSVLVIISIYWKKPNGSSGDTGLTATPPPNPDPVPDPNKHRITIVNNCPFTVYPAALNNSNVSQPTPFEGGTTLEAGKSLVFDVNKNWAGRLWARTGCNFLPNGNGICLTGDCNGKYKCEVSGDAPTTLAEFNFDVNGNQVVYDGSNVDGFNIPMNISFEESTYQKILGTPSSCTFPSCSYNINSICPPELQVKDSNGTVVGCLSACKAGLEPNDLYCCSGIYSCSPLQTSCPPGELPCDPKTWPVNYADDLFGKYCPTFYTYPYSDDTTLFYCENAPDKLINVKIDLCPAGYNLPPPQPPTYTGFCCDGTTRCDATSDPPQFCPDGKQCPLNQEICQ